MPTPINEQNATSVTTLDAAVQELWNTTLYMEAEAQTFWKRFEGEEGSGMPIVRKDDFTKQPGDVLHINTLKLLTGSGVTGDSTLQGNEEEMAIEQTDLQVDWLRHATAITKRTKGRINFDWAVQAAQPLLSKWIANKMDNAIFTAFNAATPALFGGDATSVEELGTNDTMSTVVLDRIKTFLVSRNAMPVKDVNGNSYFYVVISPFDEYNLKQDEKWVKAQRDAALRGDVNPLFTGALGIWNGMIIHVSNRVSNVNNVSKCIAFGGEAIFRGYGMLPQFTGQITDYGFKVGVGIEAVYGEKLNDDVNTNFAIVATYAADPNASEY